MSSGNTNAAPLFTVAAFVLECCQLCFNASVGPGVVDNVVCCGSIWGWFCKSHVSAMCQGWDAYAYSCYWMEDTTKSWSDAKDFCKEKDSFLLHIGDMWVGREHSVSKKHYITSMNPLICVSLQLWTGTFYSVAVREDWVVVDWPTCSWRTRWRGGLHLGQRLASHLHPLGQKPTRWKSNT